MDCIPPGSSVHGVLPARILEWVDMPSSREPSWPRDQTQVSSISCTGRQVLYHNCHMGSPVNRKLVINVYPGAHLSPASKVTSRDSGKSNRGMSTLCAKLLQSRLTLCDPMDCSLPASSVHGLPQARILEWGDMPSSRGSSWLRAWTQISYVSCIGRWDFIYH